MTIQLITLMSFETSLFACWSIHQGLDTRRYLAEDEGFLCV